MKLSLGGQIDSRGQTHKDLVVVRAVRFHSHHEITEVDIGNSLGFRATPRESILSFAHTPSKFRLHAALQIPHLPPDVHESPCKGSIENG